MTVGEFQTTYQAEELAEINDEIEEVNDELAGVTDELAKAVAHQATPHSDPVKVNQLIVRLSNQRRRLLQRRQELEDDALDLAEDPFFDVEEGA
jgi:chromosome segregation ATPase